jgi:hypothetical protein
MNVVHLDLDDNFTTSHPNRMSQFPFLMNNQRLVGYKNELCFSNQDNHFEAGNPNETQFNDNYQIDILLSDILNSAQDQNVLPNVHGNSQLDTPTLSPQCTRNSSMLHHPSIQPIIEASKPFNLDTGLPSCFTFQMELALICDHHRTLTN